uniref:Chromo shadow domain-containing protein n=1 Tax=Tetranychus urticae TaxID=32264 RepID=T1JWZ4_TETUR
MMSAEFVVPFPDHISHPIGDFDIDEILSIATINGRLIHYVKLRGGQKTMIPSSLTNVLCPHLVIEFYQSKLFFVNIFNNKQKPAKKMKRQQARKSTTVKFIKCPSPPPKTVRIVEHANLSEESSSSDD